MKTLILYIVIFSFTVFNFGGLVRMAIVEESSVCTALTMMAEEEDEGHKVSKGSKVNTYDGNGHSHFSLPHQFINQITTTTISVSNFYLSTALDTDNQPPEL